MSVPPSVMIFPRYVKGKGLSASCVLSHSKGFVTSGKTRTQSPFYGFAVHEAALKLSTANDRSNDNPKRQLSTPQKKKRKFQFLPALICLFL